jgi:hypothetical protein
MPVTSELACAYTPTHANTKNNGSRKNLNLACLMWPSFSKLVLLVGVSPWCRFPLVWSEAGINASEVLQQENQFQPACPVFERLELSRWERPISP